MSSPKRAAKTVASKAVAKSAAKPRRAPLRAVKPAIVADTGASAEAKQLAATLERSIVDDRLDTVFLNAATMAGAMAGELLAAPSKGLPAARADR